MPGAPDAGSGTITVMSIAPAELESPESEVLPESPWVCVVWNDPINLMSYVTYVFMQYFGYARDKAESLMWDVHTKGRAVVNSGTREQMERDATAMHEYGLWSTVQKDD